MPLSPGVPIGCLLEGRGASRARLDGTPNHLELLSEAVLWIALLQPILSLR